MNAEACIGSPVKALAQLFLCLALFSQAMIPAGFMPNLGAANAATPLVICSGIEHKAIYVDHNGNPVKQAPAPHHDKPCLYSGLALVGDGLSPNLALPVDVIAVQAIFLRPSEVLSATLSLRPPAIGPPLLI